MFSFAELSTSDVVSTFAYWVIVEKKPLPKNSGTLDSLKSWMSYHYDLEEQSYTPKMLRTNKELIPKFVRLIAPVTLAERWTPFSQAIEILGQPLRAERGEGSNSSAICTFEPQFLGRCQPEDRSEHVRHFVFLLRLACSVALQEKGRVTIIGSPGWSYRTWKDDFSMINPDTALLMHEAGYLYTDRIAQ
jgi:hypothetical protein